MREVGEANAQKMKVKAISPEEDIRLLAEIWADEILVDWSGARHEDGTIDPMLGRDRKPLPFNRENAILLLTGLPELFADIREAATRRDAFKPVRLEEQGKNSQNSSTTSSAVSGKTGTKSSPQPKSPPRERLPSTSSSRTAAAPRPRATFC